MKLHEITAFNDQLAAEHDAAEHDAERSAEPAAAQEPSGITDAAVLAEIRANYARAVRIEFLPFWVRWPAQLADSLDLRWGPAR